jgi:U3 small nucleolar RNA-associated protein MPP10
VSLESQSHPHLHPFLASILDPPHIELRSSKPEDKPSALDPTELLPYTPLGELTIADMDAEQVWAQLELRAEGICAVVKEVGSGEAPDMDEEDEEEEDDDDEEGFSDEDSGEEMTPEEWERMMAEEGYEEGESEDDDESGSDADGEIRWNSDEEMGSEEGSGEEDEEEGSDDDDEEEGSDAGSDEGSASAESDDGYAPGPSKPRKKHATLDDSFFSIDEFNRLTEEQEAGRVTSGALGGDEDEDAELDDMGHMFLEEGDDDAGE